MAVPKGKVWWNGLSVLVGVAANGGVANVSDTKVAAQALHIGFVEDLNNEAEALFDVETVGEGGDACGVLATVLNGEETFVDLVGDVRAIRAKDSNESAHEWIEGGARKPGW
jgi:hypothetical protein